MSAPSELKLLRSIKTGKGLIKLIESLRQSRRISKVKGVKRSALGKKARAAVLQKTDGYCHICGIELAESKFHADHVKSHCMGGEHIENNYLPSCATCNNLRWHYGPEEIQVILKLGVWAKSVIVKDQNLGLAIANKFVMHDMKLRKDRNKTAEKKES